MDRVTRGDSELRIEHVMPHHLGSTIGPLYVRLIHDLGILPGTLLHPENLSKDEQDRIIDFVRPWYQEGIEVYKAASDYANNDVVVSFEQLAAEKSRQLGILQTSGIVLPEEHRDEILTRLAQGHMHRHYGYGVDLAGADEKELSVAIDKLIEYLNVILFGSNVYLSIGVNQDGVCESCTIGDHCRRLLLPLGRKNKNAFSNDGRDFNSLDHFLDTHPDIEREVTVYTSVRVEGSDGAVTNESIPSYYVIRVEDFRRFMLSYPDGYIATNLNNQFSVLSAAVRLGEEQLNISKYTVRETDA